jgi:circadian clock protein KaiB
MIPSGDEGARRAEEKGSFVFRLYVVNEGPGSARAIANLSALCKKHLPDNHQIEIVDLLQDPRRVLSDKIVATPTLIKVSPAPVQKIIGDLSEEAKVLFVWGDQVRQSDEPRRENIGNWCGSHRFGADRRKRFVREQHGSQGL